MKTPAADFEIAPNFKVSKWETLDIQRSTQWSEDWKKAIDIFESRINARFINQIDALINNTDNTAARYSGFAIVALDCLLIETLNQFYNGINETPRHEHAAAFHAVFQQSSKLAAVFDTKGKTEKFYDQIRCGLLHQAQTKGNSKIRRTVKTVIEWCNPQKPSEGLIVHPLSFHKCVKEVYSKYLEQLKTASNGVLRKKFRTKMNLIAGTH